MYKFDDIKHDYYNSLLGSYTIFRNNTEYNNNLIKTTSNEKYKNELAFLQRSWLASYKHLKKFIEQEGLDEKIIKPNIYSLREGFTYDGLLIDDIIFEQKYNLREQLLYGQKITNYYFNLYDKNDEFKHKLFELQLFLHNANSCNPKLFENEIKKGLAFLLDNEVSKLTHIDVENKFKEVIYNDN